MTSASTKINTTQLHRFRDCNRDVMPACVATSYPCINNEAYQREFRRDETGHLSGASSPDSPKYENCYKSRIQCSQPLHYPEKLVEEVLGYSASAKRKKYGSSTDKTSRTISTSPDQEEDSKQDSRLKFESCQNEFPKQGNGKYLDVGVGSFKQRHPLKKRLIHKKENNLKEESKEKNKIDGGSKDSTETEEEKLKSICHFDQKSSSEILRKMCASFGNHFPGFNPFDKLKNLDSLNSHSASSLNENHKRRFCERTFSGKNEPREFNSFPLASAESPCAAKKESFCASLQASVNSNKETVATKQRKAFSPQKETTVSHLGDDLQQKSKSRMESPMKRKISSDYLSPNAESVTNHHGAASPSQGPKRARYSSSDSTDSQRRHDIKDTSNIYKQNGSWYSLINPLLYSSGTVNPFAMAGNGCNMSMTGYPHSNPLMFGSNPYLASSVLMREMMNASGIASLMPFLPNTSFPAFSGASGVSPHQLQAFHQLQSAMLCQNPSIFHANNYQSPGMFPFMQNPLLAPGRSLNSFNQLQSTDKLSASQRTPSPERTPSRKLADTKHLSLSVEPTYPAFSNLTRRSNHSLNTHERPSCSDKAILSEKLSKPKQIPKSPAHAKRPDDQSKTSSHEKFLSRNTKSQSKRKSEKKVKDSAKLKEAIHKPSIIQSCPPSGVHSPDSKVAEDRKRNDSSPEGQLTKTSSYKNLTRERRLVANARERTRVHTISSAFDELRAQIPSYSCNQKLSKLAILRIACEYIRTLSVLVGHDDCISFSQGVDQCTRVLQSESRARSRRKNNKAQIEMEMENYERHKSREEGEIRPEVPGQTSCSSLFPRASSPCNNNHETFSSNFSDTQSNSQSVFVDDITETDNDIVDVESVDDDNTNDFSDFAQKNSSGNNLNNSSHSQPEKEQISRSSPTSCQSFPKQATHSDTHSNDVVVE